jgi:predicted NBD/HSP70 family sugar kinase
MYAGQARSGVPSQHPSERASQVSLIDGTVPLRHALEGQLGVLEFVDNDAHIAALAEASRDELELVARHLVMFTVGTHVGGGLVPGDGSTAVRRERPRAAAGHTATCVLRHGGSSGEGQLPSAARR